jgi:hypothetical protein
MRRLFYEDEFDALQAMVGGSGKTVKQCASFLYPDMKSESAYAKLKDQLNPKGSEELKFRQVLALMKFCENYDPLLYACDETCHARPDRKAPEDEAVRLAEAITGAADMMNRAMKQLERLQDTHPSLKLARAA